MIFSSINTTSFNLTLNLLYLNLPMEAYFQHQNAEISYNNDLVYHNSHHNEISHIFEKIL